MKTKKYLKQAVGVGTLGIAGGVMQSAVTSAGGPDLHLGRIAQAGGMMVGFGMTMDALNTLNKTGKKRWMK